MEFAALRDLVPATPARIEAAEEALARGDADEALALARWLGSDSGRFRRDLVEASALLELGDVEAAEEHAKTLPAISAGDIERARAMLLQGCCRYKRSDLPAAVELFSHALQISRDTPEPTHALRAELLSWRARCYRHQRHWNAARADIDAALDLAQIAEDEHLIAHLHFQSSIVNERLGQTHIACCLAEQARDIYERIGDRRRLARILNNLGGLNCLLGRTEVAVELLRDAYALASELGQTADAAQAISSLAQVELEAGRPAEAETSALEAIALLEGRADYAEERGNATLVLARALFQLGRHDESERAVRQAEAIFSSVSAQSCVAATLVTRGDIRRGAGNVDEAADLYRKAAELLQDFHF